MKIPELREKIQGRPKGVTRRELDRIGVGSIYATKVEVIELQEDLEKAIEKQISLLTLMVQELQQMKLHLAGMSDENIDERDVEVKA